MINDQWLSQEWTRNDAHQFRKESSVYLCTTRFNNQTYIENRNACKRLKVSCYYSNPYPLPQSIPQGATVYVLEMNNEENKIMGIGKINNYLQMDVYRVYENDFYNQMHFSSTERVSYENMSEPKKRLMRALELKCFHGRGHLKRGHRMTCFPVRTLGLCKRNGLDIIEEIQELFL